jgi:transcriptional regulator with XRE-family HTH domain
MSDQHEFDEGPVTLGEQLQRARAAKGMSLDDVANRTRIPIRHLQNIEREDWDALPAPTYAIGFARNYANAVGMDGAAVARDLRTRIGGPNYHAAAQEYYQPADPARVPPKWLALLAFLLAILLIGGYFWWRGHALGNENAAVPPLDTNAPSSAPAPAQPAAPAPVAGQPVTLVAIGEVWLRINDGRGGPSAYSASLHAGDRYQLPVALQQPMIHTGRPQMLRVLIGDHDVGLLGPDERVVDLSLKPEDVAARAAAAPATAPPVAPATAAPLAPPPSQ